MAKLHNYSLAVEADCADEAQLVRDVLETMAATQSADPNRHRQNPVTFIPTTYRHLAASRPS
jgi:hypothetical protein